MLLLLLRPTLATGTVWAGAETQSVAGLSIAVRPWGDVVYDLRPSNWLRATGGTCEILQFMLPLCSVSDGVIALRATRPGNGAALLAGRDEEFHRWLGTGSDKFEPTACITVAGEIVGWVDYDCDRKWLHPGEVNVGYNAFAPYRGKGYATRAVQLLMHHLAVRTESRTATLVVDAGNTRSLALAARLEFRLTRTEDGQLHFARQVPPLTYTDGVVAIRSPRLDDLDMDLEAKDDLQIDWMWLAGERAAWVAMSSRQQRDHALLALQRRRDEFGSGPKWTFSVDAADAVYVAYVDCDLASPGAPAGEANIAYSAHPRYRSKGYVSRGVRLIMQFLREHTGARRAHIIVDAENVESLHVALAVGGRPTERWVDLKGRTMIRHVVALRA